MHDTLGYLGREPVHRPWHHDQLTFAMLYEFSERFINPLSHDEVVHGKGSLLSRMPGDEWQRLANLRTLLAYMYARPGKALLFMGTELAPWGEWDHDHSLPWNLLDDPPHRDFERFVAELGRVYRGQPALWRRDPDPASFQWIDCADRHNSVLSFARWDEPRAGSPTPDHLVTVLNLTPVPRQAYRIGVPRGTSYATLLNTDEARWGGSDLALPDRVQAEAKPWHGLQHSNELVLPPLAALVLRPEG
jgi:1,4-alpha-glucan branching enzyme